MEKYEKKFIECPFCNWKGKSFSQLVLDELPEPIPNVCPKCQSFERHRLYCLYLKKNISKTKKLKVLHFAPENCLATFFKSYKNIDYISADIDPQKAMKKENITNISFPDNSFDIIFCSHVLEHIEDDQKAMKELHRILKYDGFAILQVPMRNLKKTYEDFSITDPKKREKMFGQFDHVRIYGNDYEDRLKQYFLKVKKDNFIKSINKNDRKKYVLSKEYIYVCHKS